MLKTLLNYLWAPVHWPARSVPPGALCCLCGVLGHLAPIHRCAQWGCCVACAASWATWLLFTGVLARRVALRVRRPGPLGWCSLVRTLRVSCCVCGVLGHLAPGHRCARSACCVVCAASWATWLLFTGVLARRVALRVRRPGPLGSCSLACPLRAARCVVLSVRCPGPLGSCSPVCPLRVLCCMCGVLGYLTPVHRCAGSACRVACAASWATWLLFTGVLARRVASRVRRPGPLGSCSPVCPLRAARCVVLPVRCPGPLGSCSAVFPLGVLCCVCGVLGHLAPVHRCAQQDRPEALRHIGAMF